VVKEIERGFKEEEYYGWRCAEHMVDKYLAGCLAASSYDSIFKNFKKQDSYGYILEHVPPDLGTLYLRNIETNNPALLHEFTKFTINDKLGNPYLGKFKFSKIENLQLQTSPTTTRYVKVLSDLITLYGSLDNLNIVEIGAGYGGLALVISQHFNVKNYYDIDLFEPGRLADRYCRKEHKINNFHVLTPEQLDELENVEIDLVISNYAFSECNYETQDIYIDKILSKAKRGYITHNNSEERRNRTKSIIEAYDGFKVFDVDLCKKEHPIFTWGNSE